MLCFSGRKLVGHSARSQTLVYARDRTNQIPPLISSFLFFFFFTSLWEALQIDHYYLLSLHSATSFAFWRDRGFEWAWCAEEQATYLSVAFPPVCYLVVYMVGRNSER